MYGLYFDPMYFLFALPALALALFAQWRVSSAYKKYTNVRNAKNMTDFVVVTLGTGLGSGFVSGGKLL